MKAYSIGDSHSDFSFRNVLEHRYSIAPMTMHRVRRDKINFLEVFKNMGVDVPYDSFVIFCFGEIDVRCHIFNQINLGNLTEDEIIKNLATDYISHINTQKSFFEKVGILSVTPPSTNINGKGNNDFPFTGSDKERSRYTTKLNHFLKTLCQENNVKFIDAYKYYADENGMLMSSMSDGSVHIGNTTYIKIEFLKHI